MTNATLYGAMGATGVPMTGTLVTIDGSLVGVIGLFGLCIGGVLLSVALRRMRSRRRVRMRPLTVRRAAA